MQPPRDPYSPQNYDRQPIHRPGRPDPTPTTMPMPYQNPAPMAPPPPPSWESTQTHILPPNQSPRVNLGLSIAVFLLVFVATLGIGGYVLAQRGLVTLPKLAGSTKATATTIPPTATLALTATPAPTDGVPPPDDGFQTYDGSNGVWGLNIPTSANTQNGSISVAGVNVPYTEFDVQNGADLSIYDVPLAIPDSEAQIIFNALVGASGATNVTIVEQPHEVTIGANTWQRMTVTATLNGEEVKVAVLYATHGSGAIAVSATATIGDFDNLNSEDFTPMEQSFTYLK